MVPFLRDSICYILGLMQLFLFYMVITPGHMDIYESICLCIWWVGYIILVYRTDILARNCCCCLDRKHVDKILKIIESAEPTAAEKAAQRTAALKNPNAYVQLGDVLENADEDTEESVSRMSYVKQPSIIKRDESGHFGVLYDERGLVNIVIAYHFMSISH